MKKKKIHTRKNHMKASPLKDFTKKEEKKRHLMYFMIKIKNYKVHFIYFNFFFHDFNKNRASNVLSISIKKNLLIFLNKKFNFYVYGYMYIQVPC